MPHYKDGRKAELGDLVVDVNPNHVSRSLGVIVQISPSATACNAQLVPLATKHGELPWMRDASPYTQCVTLADLLPLEAVEKPAQPVMLADPVGAGG